MKSIKRSYEYPLLKKESVKFKAGEAIKKILQKDEKHRI